MWVLQVKCPAALQRWITAAVGESRGDAAHRGARYYRDFPCPCILGQHPADRRNPDQVRVVCFAHLSEVEQRHVAHDLAWLTERFAEMWMAA